MNLANLDPVAQLRSGRLPRRLSQLAVGLTLYGVSLALVLRCGLGMMPWEVLHYGLAVRSGLSIGLVLILTALVVLLAWIPLRQLPGLGTLLNAVWLGIVLDATLRFVATPAPWWGRVGLMVGGIVLNGLATALYLGAQFGPGPRDGLMTGLARRTGWPIRLVRTGIEAAVVASGWLLGGSVGVATIAYALAIGPLVHWLLPPCLVQLTGNTASLERIPGEETRPGQVVV